MARLGALLFNLVCSPCPFWLLSFISHTQQDCYRSRCLRAGAPQTTFPGACLSGCQWRSARTQTQCEKLCYDNYISKEDNPGGGVLHTKNRRPHYQQKLVTSCQYGCAARCNGLPDEKAVGCLTHFAGGLKGQCEAQTLRRLR